MTINSIYPIFLISSWKIVGRWGAFPHFLEGEKRIIRNKAGIPKPKNHVNLLLACGIGIAKPFTHTPPFLHHPKFPSQNSTPKFPPQNFSPKFLLQTFVPKFPPSKLLPQNLVAKLPLPGLAQKFLVSPLMKKFSQRGFWKWGEGYGWLNGSGDGFGSIPD